MTVEPCWSLSLELGRRHLAAVAVRLGELGFPSFEDYVRHSQSHGIIAGRVANRTAGARFVLDGAEYRLTANHGAHHLHGGAVGLGRRIWEMETDDAANAVHLLYASPDGEEGYPGAVDFEVTFRLEGARLICAMSGVPDRPTPVNLAQHSYYNLGGGGDVLDHEVEIVASWYTPTGPDLIPDGTIAPVAGISEGGIHWVSRSRTGSVGVGDPGRASSRRLNIASSWGVSGCSWMKLSRTSAAASVAPVAMSESARPMTAA